MNCSKCRSDIVDISDRITDLSSSFPYLLLLPDIQHLTNLDIDLNMPSDSNFGYFSL